jgi:hypothetical protein
MSGQAGQVCSKDEGICGVLASAEVGRFPYLFWIHSLGTDLDLNFVKAMPNGLYCVEGLGAVAEWSWNY